MARPREFDEATALDAAVQYFWANGYDATSIRDLADKMGITGASLYNAFGDKRSLFKRSLDRYVEQSFADRVGRFERLPPRQALQAFFDEIIERSLRDRQRKGCMLVNSALDAAPHDPDQRQVFRPAAFLHDFVRQPLQRTVNLRRGHQLCFLDDAHGRVILSSLTAPIHPGSRVLENSPNQESRKFLT